MQCFRETLLVAWHPQAWEYPLVHKADVPVSIHRAAENGDVDKEREPKPRNLSPFLVAVEEDALLCAGGDSSLLTSL